VFESDENKNPSDWSPDGRYLLFATQSPQSGFDLMALPLFGERKPIVVARSPQAEVDGRISPDGRWVAYVSTETGSPEVYVQPFPPPGARTQVSIGGGSRPRWRRDSGELFYAALDNRLMVVPITTNGKAIEQGPLHLCSLCRVISGTNRLATVSGFSPPPTCRERAPSPSSSTGSRPYGERETNVAHMVRGRSFSGGSTHRDFQPRSEVDLSPRRRRCPRSVPSIVVIF
jgi:hypothetical protein